MPIKHQSACYRTIAGVRWINLADLVSVEMESAASAVREAGYRIKVQVHPDGFRRAFVHPEDLTGASGVFNANLGGQNAGD